MATSSGSRQEQAILEALVPGLEADGFTVFLQPSGSMLPPPLRKAYRPDAIALKEGKKLAIEVVSLMDSDRKLELLRALFAQAPDWELRVVYAPPRAAVQELSAIPKDVIEGHLKRLSSVSVELGAAASLLIAWSLFEAAARLVVPESFSGPQAPKRLIELLASDGYITPDEAATLRRVAELRNQAAHGALDVEVTTADVDAVVRAVQTLLSQQEPVLTGA